MKHERGQKIVEILQLMMFAEGDQRKVVAGVEDGADCRKRSKRRRRQCPLSLRR